MLSSYEGQQVSSLQIGGRPGLQISQFESLLAQKNGQPFSLENIRRTVAALKAAGKFDYVRVEVEPEASGIQVLFVLEPAVYFGIFEFPGAAHFPYAQLIQAANYPIQTPFNVADVESGRRSLLAFFRREGYFQAEVQTQVQVDSAHKIANVVFHTTLGPRAKFGSVDIQGAPTGDTAHLHHELTGLWARLHAAAIRPGKTYKHGTVTRGTSFLRNQLAKQSYLGAQVKVEGAEYHGATNRADIHFGVKPGVPTHVKIIGAHLWSWDRKSLLPVYQGIGVDQEAVLEGQQALVSYFQGKGYFDVKVDSQLQTVKSGDTVFYRIEKEKKHRVTSVHLAGNSKLSSSQLTPSIAVKKKSFVFWSHGDFSQKLVSDSIKNLTGIYKSEGFSNVKVSSSVKNSNGNIEVYFRVDEGPRDLVNSIAIEGAATFPESKFAPGGLQIRAGQPYSQAHVEADRAAIVANYLKAGYLNAGFHETASQVSKQQPHRINVVYHIYEGPRVMTARVITLGRKHTNQELIDRDVAQIKPARPLTESALLTSGSNLYNHTGVFDWAEVDPKREITTQNNEDVLVKVHEAQRNTITYGFGFEVIERGGSIPSGTVALPNLPPIGLPSKFTASEKTFWGPRGTFQYTRNNLRGKGESFSFTAFAGRLDQRGAVYYIDPNFRWSPWRATTSYSIDRDEENPIYSSQEQQGSVQFQRAVDKAEKTILFFRYSYSKTDLTRLLIPGLVPTQDLNVRLSTISGNFTRDTRDNPMNEHRGVLDSLELDFNTSKLGSTADFAKLTAQSAFYKEAFHHIVWAESVRIGLAQPFNHSFVPLSETFFTGGSNTLRGFPLDDAGPQRPVFVCSSGQTSNCPQIEVPKGGHELLILNSEARIPLSWVKKGLGFVLFYDGGDVFPYVGFNDFTSLYSNNVGIGLRYNTPVGPIRFDVGYNLNNTNPSVSSTQYSITIGQAF
ncbi:MAG: POTRA domain-containing protein [Terracidiphilus sp.]